MRTAKEILFDNLIQSQIDWIKEDERNLIYIIDAMEQYADQFRKPDVIGSCAAMD